ncbi:reverse transcriptase domain-containing protein [Tanacetum coccineum]
MEALTTKIDSQFKDIKGEMKEMRDRCNSCGGPHPSSECDDKPMGGPKYEESNYAYGGYRGGGYRGNYYGRRSGNWRDHQPRDENRNSQPREVAPSISPTPENKFNESNFEKTMREFMVARKSSNDFHVNVVFTRSGLTYDSPVNPNAKTTVTHDDSDDEVDEAAKEVEPSSSKHTKINIPRVDVLDGMPNYEKFLKDLVSNKSKMEQISDAFLNEECSAIVQNKLPPKLGDPGSFLIPCTVAGSVEYLALADLSASINLMPYSLYASLSGNTLKPTRMSIRLANHTYQYSMVIVKNMLVQVGKFVFLADFVILQMEEGVGDDRITFLIDKVMRHSHSNDDTCFCMDVIDEVMKEELDALLDDSKPFSTTSEKISESLLDHEFEEFMTIKIEEIPEQEEEVENSFEVLPLEEYQMIKNSIQEPPTDLVMKPLPKHLEYAFLEKDSLLPVFISTLLQDDEKKRLISVHKKHKEAFA